MHVASDEPPFVYKSTTVIVDSRDRDVAIFPNPASYDISIDEELQDVTTLELVGAEVPMVAYLVSSNKNDRFYFSWTGSQVPPQDTQVVIRAGDYSPAELASEIQSVMNAAASDAGAFRASYVSRTDNFQIRSKQPFSLRFEGGAGISRLLGFAGNASIASVADVATDPLYSACVSSTYRRDFESNRYAVLHIEPAYVNYSSCNTTINKSFAIIPRKGTDMNLCAEHLRSKTFNPPIPKFAKLRISIYDRDGQLYDMQNRDHRLELRFTCIRQKKYTQQKLQYLFDGIVSDK